MLRRDDSCDVPQNLRHSEGVWEFDAAGRDSTRHRVEVLTGGTSLSVFAAARVEDHDDIMRLFEQQTSLQQHSQLAERPFFLAEMVEAQDEDNQTAVCEVGLTSPQKHTRRIPSGGRSD